MVSEFMLHQPNKKIIFISYFLPPLLSPQSIQIGRVLKYLKSQGYELEVITGDYLGGTKDKELYPDLLQGLKSHKITQFESTILSILKYKLSGFFPKKNVIDDYEKWNARAFQYICNNGIVDSDTLLLTFACPFSSNILGRKLKEKYKCKWISFNSDPWAQNIHSTNTVSSFIADAERDCFSYTDKLIFTSFETVEMYKARYPELASRMEYLDHSFDKNLFPESDVNSKRTGSKIVLSYVGTFYGKRTPEPLLKALRNLNLEERNKLLIQFVGSGYGLVKHLWPFRDLREDWKIIPRVSYLRSLEIMRESDVLLLIDADSSGKSIFFPSKLVDYIGSGRPILGITPEGTSSRVIEEVGGKSFRNKDLEGLTNFLRQLKSPVLPKIDSYLAQKYESENTLPKIKKIIDHFVK